MAYDIIKFSNKLQSYKQWFCLSPQQWQACQLNICLSWKSVKYERNNRRRIPRQRGIYAFVVKPDVAEIFNHGYLLYIGQTGEACNRTLFDRYPEYMNRSQIRKRQRIERMMANWKDQLYFYYVPIKDKRRSLKKIEFALNDALIPPYVKGDFSAIIKKAMRAWT